MFVILLRELVIGVTVLTIIYIVYKQIRRTKIKNRRREIFEEAQLYIESVIKEASKIPNFDKKKLKEARNRIEQLIKEGNK